jgi:hypothetical protein
MGIKRDRIAEPIAVGLKARLAASFEDGEITWVFKLRDAERDGGLIAAPVMLFGCWVSRCGRHD